MERASAFVPGHISGFFRIHDESENPLKMGSRNCGLCMDAGVKTSVEVEDGDCLEVKVFIGGRKDEAETTERAVFDFLESIEKTCRVRVDHDVQAPISSGYGMSGAGTLGAMFALTEALDLDIGEERILAEAHKAEVACQSGLGDVGPQLIGGLVVGLKPGAPPFGEWERIGLESDWGVVCATLGTLSTSDFLKDSANRKRSKERGDLAMEDLLREKSLENFMQVSKKFATGLGVFDDDFLETLDDLSSECPVGAGAVMLGKSIFAPAREPELDTVEGIFLDHFPPSEVMRADLDFEGARLLDSSE